MKILWVKTDFLHPTTRGGQIRSLHTLRYLRRRHEVHYAAYHDPSQTEGLDRSSEYCSVAHPVARRSYNHRSPAFAMELAAGLFSALPVAVRQYRSSAMRDLLTRLTSSHRFDRLVCDFLFPAPNLPDLAPWTLFQHNVEAVIWQRRVDRTHGWAQSRYIRLQAKRMLAYEKAVCRGVRKILAVSDTDADGFRKLYGVQDVSVVPTGVDLEYFAPPQSRKAAGHDLCFLGSMDWMPNIDGALWFVREVLPIIQAKRPGTKVAFVGRSPAPALQKLAGPDLIVTGTVPDVRPYLFGSLVSIVPLHVGGGTRLKIYEAMAARTPVVSTTIGAEGLDVVSGRHILIADQPQDFAAMCLRLLESPAERERLASAAWQLVSDHYSWEAVSTTFEKLLFE